MACISLEQQLNELKDFIKNLHNPGLIDQSMAPNGNIIYHIYEDGEITHQKGSYAYKQRTEFVEKYPSLPAYKIPADIFPITHVDHFDKKHGYAIVTQENAYIILERMKNVGN